MENVVVYLYDINNMKICDFRSVNGEAVHDYSLCMIGESIHLLCLVWEKLQYDKKNKLFCTLFQLLICKRGR